MRRYSTVTCIFALLTVSASASVAQQSTTTARSLGLANSFTARARGYEAPAWNPANLGLADSPSWSLGIVGATAYLNSNSWSYGQIADLYGTFIDDETKTKLLEDIRRGDPDRMLQLNADVSAQVLSASIWRFAFGFGAVGAGNVEASSDAIELLLFGNVGQDGNGKDFSLEASDGDGWVLSSAFIAYAQPFTVPALDHLNMRFSIGGTAKYGIAHGLAHLLDRGSLLTSDPLAVEADAELLSSNSANAGRHWAIDIGAAMDWGSLTAGIALQNAFGDISWNRDDFELRTVAATANFDSTTATDTTLAFAELTPEDQGRIDQFFDDADIPKRLRLGAVFRVSPMLTLSGDYEELLGGNLRTRWDRSLSVGGEWVPIDALPLRVGVATDFKNLAVTGGLGLYISVVHLDFSFGRWGFAVGDGAAVSLSLSIWP